MLRVGLIALAAWAIHGELAGLEAGALLAELRGFGAARFALAVAATVASFVVLGGIELMALGYVRLSKRIPRGTGMLTGFVANAFSQSVGVALLTGGAVRARAYRRYGVEGADVARMSAFVTVTVTLGLMTTGAAAFLESSAPLRLWRMVLPTRLVGAVLAVVVIAYLMWGILGTRGTRGTRGAGGVLGHGAWRVERPTRRASIGQVVIASLDWVITGSLLFLVLPAAIGIGFFTALRVYLVAQTVGTASHVPGGAGVFDLLVLALLAPLAPPASRAAIVASLIAFRVLYYFVPLVVACGVAAVAELRAPKLVHGT